MQRKREQAIRLLEQGLTQTQIARSLDVDPRSVRRWKHDLRRGGWAALKAVPASGRPLKLSAGERRRLERQLLKGAQAAGFPTDLWTCPRVAEHIERTFGIRYHVDHVGRLLQAMNWSPQKPARKAIERDEQGIGQ
ncbi:MAG: winged helix-turn-helix domain-containing protein [Terracidiphilus sp.]